MNEHHAVRVGVVFGGRSSEHEVSLASARNVMDALHQAGYQVTPIGITPQGRWLTNGNALAALTAQGAQPENGALRERDAWGLLPRAASGGSLPAVDVIFPVLHGPYGEDGTVQGLLEMANLPYVGCGVLASALAMDKAVAKRIFADAGLPQVDYCVLLRSVWEAAPEEAIERMERDLTYPLFVKPANLGSSVGVAKAHDRRELAAALDDAARFDRKLVVEQAVLHAREIEVSVLGNDEPIASAVGEIVPGAEFYDYAAKYLDDNSQLLIPAPLDEELAGRIRRMAVQAFRAIDGSGLARVDFLVNGKTNEIFLNEVNTMPGFTRISMYPKLWEASGVSYPELVDRLVKLGLDRYADRQRNVTTRNGR
jgi:D-alanine-D-alanine ligase